MIRLLIADDEKLEREALAELVQRRFEREVVLEMAENGRKAADTAVLWNADLILMDIEMPGMSGIALAQRLKELCPRGNLIFVTGFSQYMAEAFQLHASGYIRKPVTVKAVEEELRNLRYPVQERAVPTLRVQAFGNFEVFYGGRPVHFSRSRTKELFAYLIDRRGAGSTMGELISILWEGHLDTPSIRCAASSRTCGPPSRGWARGRSSLRSGI